MVDKLRAAAAWVSSGWLDGDLSNVALWIVALVLVASVARVLTALLVYLSALHAGRPRFTLSTRRLIPIWCTVGIFSLATLFWLNHAIDATAHVSSSSGPHLRPARVVAERIGTLVLLLSGPLSSAIYLARLREDARRIACLQGS